MLMFEGFGYSGNNVFPLSRSHNSSFIYQSSVFFNGTNFEVETGSSISFDKVYIICKYTKTTD